MLQIPEQNVFNIMLLYYFYRKDGCPYGETVEGYKQYYEEQLVNPFAEFLEKIDQQDNEQT